MTLEALPDLALASLVEREVGELLLIPRGRDRDRRQCRGLYAECFFILSERGKEEVFRAAVARAKAARRAHEADITRRAQAIGRTTNAVDGHAEQPGR